MLTFSEMCEDTIIVAQRELCAALRLTVDTRYKYVAVLASKHVN